MASKARKAFDKNVKDVERLLDIHKSLGGTAQGRRYQLEVLNKSAIVLITAFWEAYCEDMAAEALNHLVAHLPDASKLPKKLKKRLATEIKQEKNELAMWDLADDGWQVKVKDRLKALTVERNRNLNTPKSTQIDELFDTAIGLPAVSKSWNWNRTTVQAAKKKLDKYVTLRGSLAHRGSGNTTCLKKDVQEYFELVKRLAGKTGGRVYTFVRQTTGKSLW